MPQGGKSGELWSLNCEHCSELKRLGNQSSKNATFELPLLLPTGRLFLVHHIRAVLGRDAIQLCRFLLHSGFLQMKFCTSGLA